MRSLEHIDIIHGTHRHGTVASEMTQCTQYYIIRPHHTIPKQHSVYAWCRFATDRFDDEERVAVVGSFVERETAVRRDVDAERTLEGRQRLRAEVGDRHEDAGH